MYKQQLTDLGRDAIAESHAAQTLRFTRVVLGEGEHELTDIPEMTQLDAPVMEARIAEVAPRSIGQVTVTARIFLNDIPRTFDMHEIGLFAEVGGGPEILYAVSIAIEHPTIITPTMPGGSTDEHTIALAVIVGNTLDVTGIFDPDVRLINIGPPSVGPGIYSRRTGNTFELKRLIGVGVTITEDDERITFTAEPQAPVGSMMPFAGQFAPQHWLLCDGASYLRTDYPGLSAILGSAFGGTTTHFQVPDCRGRTLVGAGQGAGLSNRLRGAIGGSELHALALAELASHSHSITDPTHGHAVQQWAHDHPTYQGQHTHYTNGWPTNASRYAPGGQTFRGVEEMDGPVTTVWPATIPLQILGATANIAITWGGTGINGTNANGSGNGHQNMQPFLVVSYIIKAD